MYLLAKELAGTMKAIMQIESEIAEAKNNQQAEEIILGIEERRSALINNVTRDELMVIQTVMNVGRSERGDRYHFNSEDVEIINLPIELNEHELMQKYSYYLIHKTKEELAHGIEYHTLVSSFLKEGIEILKL
ncbi:MAG: hypothetical protein ACE3K2_00215 [Paenibacillus sp.]|uniref:hypothetical protein n=1 Tax=Paenibacillus sp. TaxID=58172 RepID=UPI003B81FED7